MAEKDLQKTTKKVVKKAASKTSSTSKKSASKTVKVKELRVTQADMAYVLGVTAPNVLGLTQSGSLTRGDDGLYDLVTNVSGYCRALRERKTGGASTGSKSSIDVETAKWKLENIKSRNRDWRMQRDREVALEIIRSLTTAMTDFREKAAMNPGLVAAIDEMLGRIGSVNVDSVSIAVEGDEDDNDGE